MYATKADLIAKYGEEAVDKAASRTVKSVALDDYIESEDTVARDALIEDALLTACNLIDQRLNTCFDLASIKKFITDNPSDYFISLKNLNMQYAMAFLKEGGDCKDCEETEKKIHDLCKYKLISKDGICLDFKGRFLVTDQEDCWDTDLNCGKGSCYRQY